MEREIVEPVEEAFCAISGVDWSKTTSNATDGLAQFIVFFDFEKAMQAGVAGHPRRDLDQARDLPTEMKEPVLTRFDPGQRRCSRSRSRRRRSPRGTSPASPIPTDRPGDLRSMPGVAQVTVVGGVKREMTVELRPARLQAAGVGVAQVVQAPRPQNLAAPVGRLNGALEERADPAQGAARRRRRTSRAGRGRARRDGSIRLGQVADVLDGTEEQRTAAALYNGQGRRRASRSRRPRATAPPRWRRRFASEWPACRRRCRPGAKLEIVQDAGDRVSARGARTCEEALIEGALLTVLVVFLFLNSWRSTVITGLALPVSVLASFIAVWAFGFTLNTMSLLGLSLAIGILIDDAIVVRENIVRHIEMGKDHFTGVARGHRRDRPRGGGHDVLDRRGVRADRVHVRRWRGSGSSRSR